MVLPGSVVWAAVPVPDVGPPPPGYSPSGAVVVVAVLTVLALLAFVTVTVGARALARRDVSPLRPALVTGAGLAVGVVVLGLLVTQGQARARDEAAAFAAEERAARVAATQAVEERHGVRLAEGSLVSLVREAAVPVEVTLPDGSEQTCLLGTFDRVYELRCGAQTWDGAEPLPVVEEASS